jgi:ABC-type branched-subunit amino acid transport system ATPase component
VFKPKILLVDDVTLGMEDEPEQEAKVKQGLENAMAAVTAIYFTERANYASRLGCHIVVLEKGRVAQ